VIAKVDQLRARDSDPEYAEAPVLDVYGRISQEADEKVDRQLADCLDEIDRRGVRLGKVLRDDGRSAWKRDGKRPDWDELFTRLDAGTSAGVICWHTDRLMRQPWDLERLIRLAEGRGLIVGSCHGDYNLGDADARFTLRVLTAAAMKESDSTSRRQKAKAQSMRAAGKRSGGGRPFGLPGRRRNEHGEMVPVPDEQVAAEREAIQWAVRAHLDGTATLGSIAREWNASGLSTSLGNTWDPRTVSAVLLNGRNAGVMQHNGEIVGRYTEYEPIISEAEWRELLAVAKTRKRGRPVTAEYVLSGGHLICCECGKGMNGKRKNSGSGTASRRYYVCRDSKHVVIVADRVEEAVGRMLVKVLSDPKHARQVATRSTALAESETKLAKARATATGLAQRLANDRMTLDDYDLAMGPINVRVERLFDEVAALRRETSHVAVVRAATAAEIDNKWTDPTVPVEERRAMVAAVAPYGIVVNRATKAQHATSADVSERLEVLTSHRR
jgi:DNA invertase Pin-like site-specific DNA recombinase